MRYFIELGCWFILIFIMLCISTVHADPLRVAVIDTGLSLSDPRLVPHLCPSGHTDFTGEGIQDDIGHGTHVAGLIEKYAGDSNYCLVILKFYGLKQQKEGGGSLTAPIEEAIAQHAGVINLSVSGGDFIAEEKNLICNHPEIKFNIAAGNESIDLDDSPRYPQSYLCSNISVVGAFDFYASNRGEVVKYQEEGNNVYSTLPNNQGGNMTGTSMACAIHTGKVVNALSHKLYKSRGL